MSEKNSYVDSFKVIADFAQKWGCSPYQHNLSVQLQKARREIKWKGLSQKDIDEIEQIHNSSWYKNQMKNHVNRSNFVGASKHIAKHIESLGKRSC